MPFKNNDIKINKQGRPKGSRNKKTEFTLNIISEILENGKDKFIKELNELSGKNYVNSYLSLIEYQLPKLQRITPDNETDNIPQEITISFSD